MAAPLRKQLIANGLMIVLLVTIPLWVLPVVSWKLYRYAYEEICGWDDFSSTPDE